MRLRTLASTTLLASLFAASAIAADGSPVGTWKSIDDATGEPKALIEISERDGTLEGRIVELFRKPGEEPNPLCTQCSDERKDQPIVGMTILTGLRPDGPEWSNGMILDPKNGKVYRAKASLSDDGQSLNVRGYLGMAMFGRTQVWQRQPDAAE
ncbi:DUF2147 domain-containing protein [Coralloluteibacterium thermophilus]|uniref:DUF2147 domain-containing protein n=1 Tax=Coralloluteibacterium thermophilum TaxID=2707049 RepID=A0ABV9NNN8_9GAMM